MNWALSAHASFSLKMPAFQHEGEKCHCSVQALREKRVAEQPGKKKRKRVDEDEDASTADEMSDSDDAVGMFPAIFTPARLTPAPRALCTSFCGTTAFSHSCSLPSSV